MMMMRCVGYASVLGLLVATAALAVGCVEREVFDGIALAAPTGPGPVEAGDGGGARYETTVDLGDPLDLDITATGHDLVGDMQIHIERTGGTLTATDAGFDFAGSQTAYYTAAELTEQPQRTLTVTGNATEPGTIELTATAQDVYNGAPVDEQSWVLHITILAE